MMKALSVIELAQLYGMNRQSIYKRINKGDLSKNSDGKIDLSEAIRVFGEPSNKNNNVTPLQSTTVQKETEVDMLKQLEANDNQIEAIQRLLEAPKTNMTTFTDQKPSQDIATDPRSEPEPKYDGLTRHSHIENKRIPVPEHIEPEPEKRGFWSRFFLPNG